MLLAAGDLEELSNGIDALDRLVIQVNGQVEFMGKRINITYDKSAEHHVLSFKD